jgi:hypothetical protein
MFISYFNYPFCLNEWISYMSFLRETRRFLIPYEMLKPAPVLLGGLVDWLIAHSLLHSLIFLIHFLTGSCIHSLAHSFIHLVLAYHSLIHSHLRLGLGKGKELSKSSHGIVGCSGR